MSAGWAKTQGGVIVPGYLGRPKPQGRAQDSRRPTSPRAEPVKLNRAQRRAIEREMRKQAKKAARNRKALGLN